MTENLNLADPRVLEDWIAKKLARGVNLNDIIPVVCANAHVDWSTAEKMVQDVREMRGKDIARQQLPVLLILSIFILLGGVYAVISTASSLWSYYQALPPDDTAAGLMALYVGTHYTSVIKGIVGIIMLIGGGVGLGRAIGRASGGGE